MRAFVPNAAFARNAFFIAAPLALSASLCYASTAGCFSSSSVACESTAAALQSAIARARGLTNHNSASTIDLLVRKQQPDELPDGFSIAGYHGTHNGGSLLNALQLLDAGCKKGDAFFFRIKAAEEKSKVGSESSDVQANWGGTGELGTTGLYVTTNLDAALLYGAASASAAESDEVVVLDVLYRNSVAWREPPGVVTTDQQYEKFNSDTDKQHDTLVSAETIDGSCERASAGLPTQYKVAQPRIADLIFRVRAAASISDAFDVADAVVSRSASSVTSCASPLPIIRASAGHCLFNSLAWHIKATPEQRAKHRSGINSARSRGVVPFGHTAEQQQQSRQLREEVVSWMQTKIKEGAAEGKMLQKQWDLLTIGSDFSTLGGATTLDSYLDLLVNGPSGIMAPFADIQLMAPALIALYKRPIVVWTGVNKNKPLVFTTQGDSSNHQFPIELYFPFGSVHYDAVGWRGPFASKL